MCGICGLYGPRASAALDRDVRRMTRTVAHRGPDGEGTFVGDGVALGHRRLSVIDLSPAGAQPMTVGRTTVVYNGEIYNFRELRRELEAAGCCFASRSDTEVLLQAYAFWGLDGLARLEGIFAFALWDAARGRLVLVRDRLGVKPLFYAWSRGVLAFGSEIKAVLAGMETAASEVDEQALAEYLWYGNAYQERTLYRAVRALEPGHRLVLENGQQRIEPWWQIEEWLASAPEPPDLHSAAQLVREALDCAVARQLVSDVPVGIFLSGGVDSSSIAASAALASGHRLASYSVGFDYERGAGELPKARAVAERLGLDHHELHVSGGALEEVLVSLTRAHDEPFADAANIPLYLLSRALNGAIRVVLQGDGGDEMFGGYRRYSILQNAAWWRLWPRWLALVLHSLPGPTGARLARLAAAAGQRDPAMRMALLLTMETLRDSPFAMLRADARQRLEAQTDPFAA